MKSYAEHAIFEPYHLNVLRIATKLVEKASATEKIGEKVIRCHELARAVQRVLEIFGHSVSFCDGHLDGIEHTWLVFPRYIGNAMSQHILDVYVPGRVPQVQLIHDHHVVAKQYKPGDYREDIDQELMQKLYDNMRV